MSCRFVPLSLSSKPEQNLPTFNAFPPPPPYLNRKVDDQYCAVDGGITSGDPSRADTLVCQLDFPGTYFFVSKPLENMRAEIHIRERPTQTVRITDAGFSPSHVALFRGEAISFVWKGCRQKQVCREIKGLAAWAQR